MTAIVRIKVDGTIGPASVPLVDPPTPEQEHAARIAVVRHYGDDHDSAREVLSMLGLLP